MDMKEFEKKVDEFIKSFTKEEMIKILKENGFEVIENEKEGKWKPIGTDKYWYRDVNGKYESCYRYEGDGWDDWRINNIPVFQTERECIEYWEFRDAVKEKSYEFSDEEWEEAKIPKYSIRYSCEHCEFSIDTYSYNRTLGTVYFKTKEDARYIIDNYEEELLKYW